MTLNGEGSPRTDIKSLVTPGLHQMPDKMENSTHVIGKTDHEEDHDVEPNETINDEGVSEGMSEELIDNDGSGANGERKFVSANSSNPPRKRSKVSRACDCCRRKKVKCNAQYSASLQKITKRCDNCVKNHEECTFSRTPLKRGPSKGYIRDLEEKLENSNSGQQPRKSSFEVKKSNHIILPPITHSTPTPPNNLNASTTATANPNPTSNGINNNSTSLPSPHTNGNSNKLLVLPPLNPQPASPSSNSTNLTPTTSNHNNAGGQSVNSPRIQGPFWKVPYEMPHNHHDGAFHDFSRRPSLDSVSSNSTTGSRSRLPSLKPSISSEQNSVISDSDDDYYLATSIKNSRASSSSLSPRNSISSMSSLNGRIKKVNLNQSQLASQHSGPINSFPSLNPGTPSNSQTGLLQPPPPSLQAIPPPGSSHSRSNSHPSVLIPPANSHPGPASAPTHDLSLSQLPRPSHFMPSHIPNAHSLQPPPPPSQQVLQPMSQSHTPLTHSNNNSTSSISIVPPSLQQPPSMQHPQPQPSTANSNPNSNGYSSSAYSFHAKSLDQNLKLYYTNFHGNFPILPFNESYISHIIEVYSNTQVDEQTALIIDLFNQSLNNLNDYQNLNLNNCIQLFFKILSLYPFNNSGVKLNDNILLLYFSSLLLNNYAILLSGNIYSLGISLTVSIFNDFKVLENFNDLFQTLSNQELIDLNYDNIKLYLPKLYFCLLVIDNFYSLSFGIQNMVKNDLNEIIYNKLSYMIPTNFNNISIFKLFNIVNDLILNRNKVIFKHKTDFKLNKSIWNNFNENFNYKYNLNFLNLFLIIINNKYELVNFLVEISNLFNNLSFNSNNNEEKNEILYDYLLKLIRLIKTLSQDLMNYGNFIANLGNKFELLQPILNVSINQGYKLIKLCKLIIDSLVPFIKNHDLLNRLSRINNDLLNCFNQLNVQLNLNLKILSQISLNLITNKISSYNLNFNNLPNFNGGGNTSSNGNNPLADSVDLVNWKFEFFKVILPFISREDIDGWL